MNKRKREFIINSPNKVVSYVPFHGLSDDIIFTILQWAFHCPEIIRFSTLGKKYKKWIEIMFNQTKNFNLINAHGPVMINKIKNRVIEKITNNWFCYNKNINDHNFAYVTHYNRPWSLPVFQLGTVNKIKHVIISNIENRLALNYYPNLETLTILSINKQGKEWLDASIENNNLKTKVTIIKQDKKNVHPYNIEQFEWLKNHLGFRFGACKKCSGEIWSSFLELNPSKERHKILEYMIKNGLPLIDTNWGPILVSKLYVPYFEPMLTFGEKYQESNFIKKEEALEWKKWFLDYKPKKNAPYTKDQIKVRYNKMIMLSNFNDDQKKELCIPEDKSIEMLKLKLASKKREYDMITEGLKKCDEYLNSNKKNKK